MHASRHSEELSSLGRIDDRQQYRGLDAEVRKMAAVTWKASEGGSSPST